MNLKRYEPKLEKDGGLGLPSLTMQESIVGPFVLYAKYEELEAQVKRLAAENEALRQSEIKQKRGK